MPVTRTSPAPHLLAQRHTDLLRRMLIARHFTECHAPVPVPGRAGLALDIDHGEEAMLVGLSAALVPPDMLLRSHLPVGHAPAGEAGGPGMLLVRVDDPAPEHPGHLCVLFSETAAAISAVPTRSPVEPVDGRDVEAVVASAHHLAQAVRSRHGQCLLDLNMSGRLDPIDVLTVRMRAARELDDNALRAIDDNALRLVETALAAHRPPA